MQKPNGGQRLQLLETRFFDNREGFGHINRNLTKGEYEIHFKKYSGAFDVFDFTVKIYSKAHIKLIDEDEHEIQKVKLTPEQLQNIPELGNDANKTKKDDKKQDKTDSEPSKIPASASATTPAAPTPAASASATPIPSAPAAAITTAAPTTPDASLKPDQKQADTPKPTSDPKPSTEAGPAKSSPAQPFELVPAAKSEKQAVSQTKLHESKKYKIGMGRIPFINNQL